MKRAWVESLSEVYAAFYQGRYQELLTKGVRELESACGPYAFERVIVQLEVYSRLGEIQMAQELLSQFVGFFGSCSIEAIYFRGVLALLQNDQKTAQTCFELVMDMSENAHMYYRGLMARIRMAMACHTVETITPWLNELLHLKDVVPLVDQLEIEMMHAFYLSKSCGSRHQVADILHQVIAGATTHSYHDLTIRSYHGLAQAAGLQGQSKLSSQFMAICERLNSSDSGGSKIDLTQLPTMNGVSVQSQISDYITRGNLKVDLEYQRTDLGKGWRCLAKKPLILGFCVSLMQRDGAVSKEVLAKDLWPDQLYRRATHDPRIYDISRRLRSLLTQESEGAWYIQGSREGYRLLANTKTERGRLFA